jgi:hypothetical protein
LSQSSTIAFFLIAGFVMYVTVKGELTDYAGVLGIGPKASQYGSTWTTPPATNAAGQTSTGSAILSTLGSIVKGAAEATVE